MSLSLSEIFDPKPHIVTLSGKVSPLGECYRYVDGNAPEQIYLMRFPIVKETPRGFWTEENGEKHFVLSDPDGKRFAYRDKADAWKSYLARKEMAVRILQSNLAKAELRLRIAKELQP